MGVFSSKYDQKNLHIIFVLKFVIFQKLFKIEIFSEKNKNKHNSKCLRPIFMRFSIFTSILYSP